MCTSKPKDEEMIQSEELSHKVSEKVNQIDSNAIQVNEN